MTSISRIFLKPKIGKNSIHQSETKKDALLVTFSGLWAALKIWLSRLVKISTSVNKRLSIVIGVLMGALVGIPFKFLNTLTDMELIMRDHIGIMREKFLVEKNLRVDSSRD